MCDQDHFENDRLKYEALGFVTRKQFGVMLGAGIAMMLPKTAAAAAVTESEVTVPTPDGSADCYFAHPSNGAAAGVLVWPDIFGLRPAFRQMGKKLARIRVRGAGGESLLSHEEGPYRRSRRRHTDPTSDATRADFEREHARDRRQSVCGVAGRAAAGREEP